MGPAGCGDSTLVASWLATYDGPSALLLLNEDDNDLTLFLGYFSAAIQAIFPDALEETPVLLQTSPTATGLG